MAKSKGLVITQALSHEIKNDLTAVQVAAEGLCLLSGQYLPFEHRATLEGLNTYINKLNQEVIELLDLLSADVRPTYLRAADISLVELTKHKEFRFLKPELLNLCNLFKDFDIVIRTDPPRFYQLFNSIIGVASKQAEHAPNWSANLTDDKKTLQIIIQLNPKEALKFNSPTTDLSIEFIKRWCELLNIYLSCSELDGEITWELKIPNLTVIKKLQCVLFVTDNLNHQYDDMIQSINGIVKSVSTVQDALNQLQGRNFSTIFLDGAVNLGERLALAKLVRHDLKLSTRTILFSPEKSVDEFLAHEFGIDEVVDTAIKLKEFL